MRVQLDTIVLLNLHNVELIIVTVDLIDMATSLDKLQKYVEMQLETS
ncbi:protein of unknown function [Paenibacillus alvei]|uniref:Uncharacterized protein n=1 Tax=Paenibacillus alvei TaxID=44250 RepID=A0A383RCT7_PAEAL|nr:protein of unknown function [Paenibacillus alvei]